MYKYKELLLRAERVLSPGPPPPPPLYLTHPFYYFLHRRRNHPLDIEPFKRRATPIHQKIKSLHGEVVYIYGVERGC